MNATKPVLLTSEINYYEDAPLMMQEHSYGISVDGVFTGIVEHGGKYRDTYYLIDGKEVDRDSVENGDDELEYLVGQAISKVLGLKHPSVVWDVAGLVPSLPEEFVYGMPEGEETWFRSSEYSDSPRAFKKELPFVENALTDESRIAILKDVESNNKAEFSVFGITVCIESKGDNSWSTTFSNKAFSLDSVNTEVGTYLHSGRGIEEEVNWAVRQAVVAYNQCQKTAAINAEQQKVALENIPLEPVLALRELSPEKLAAKMVEFRKKGYEEHGNPMVAMISKKKHPSGSAFKNEYVQFMTLKQG